MKPYTSNVYLPENMEGKVQYNWALDKMVLSLDTESLDMEYQLGDKYLTSCAGVSVKIPLVVTLELMA